MNFIINFSLNSGYGYCVLTLCFFSMGTGKFTLNSPPPSVHYYRAVLMGGVGVVLGVRESTLAAFTKRNLHFLS